jgi:hypothetical protein
MWAVWAEASPQILVPGRYHGDEVKATSGEKWLGLFLPADGGTVVAPVVLQVDTVLDELLDENGVRTGKRVGFDGGEELALWLMKDVPRVAPGPVRTIATDVTLAPNEPVPLSLEATHPLVVQLSCPAPESAKGGKPPACELVLREGEKTQILATYEAYYEEGTLRSVGNDAPVRIVWAGDLDRDGRLDLVVDLSDHYNLARPTLFLSADGQEGAIVTAVAQHQSTGC